jgi:photosystem II stability/assembly factor-like uncharacterized protein
MTRLRYVAFLLFGACVAGGHALHSQSSETAASLVWQAAAGPLTGNAKALAESDSGTLFAYVNSEIYRSRDDGVSWTRCESQPSNRAGDLVFDRWLLTSGHRLYVSASSGAPMYVTDDECASSRPIPKPPGADSKRWHVTVVDGVLVAVFNGPTLFTSSNEGRTWEQGQSPLPDGVEPRLVTRNGAVFLVLSQQLFRTIDRGHTWSRLASNGPQFAWVVPGGERLYAGASGGIWRSTDDGRTWARMFESGQSGLTAATARGSRVYASQFNPGATARSVDGGNTWTKGTQPLRLHSSNAPLETRRGALLSATGAGIYRSTDRGTSWTATGTRREPVRSLVAGRGRAYASVADASLWTSVDSGLTWSRVDWWRADNPRRFESVMPLSPLFIIDGARLRGATNRELLASDDAGITWSSAGLSKGVNALVRSRDSWFAGTWEGVFRSEDLAHWTECSSGLPAGSVTAITALPSGDLIVLDGSTLYRSQDECRTWWPLTPLPFPGFRGATVQPTLASDPALGIVALGTGIAQLSLSERKWTLRAESRHDITAFAKDDRGRYWLGTRGGVLRLSIDGSEWRLTPAGLDGDILAVAADPGGYLLAAVAGRGMFRARLP